MNNQAYWQAKARMERAWKEAGHINNHSPPVKEIVRLRQKTGQSLGQLFSQIEDNPCGECGRCCEKAAMDSGYWTHGERTALIQSGFDPEEYVVNNWGTKMGEPEFRCLFLGPQGCNVPAEYRSTTCLTYACYDKLRPDMKEQPGVYSDFVSLSSLMKGVNTRLSPPQDIPDPEDTFGEG